MMSLVTYWRLGEPVGSGRRSGLPWGRGLSAVAALVMLAGCVATAPRADYEQAGRYVEAATGQAMQCQPEETPAGLAEARERVRELLEGGLTADEAAQVCLLNNRQLQAALCEIGAARGDLVQAGLLANPTLSVGLGFPDGGGLAKLDIGIAQNLADLWQIPVRQRLAQAELQRTVLRISREASVAVYDTKAAYYQAQQAGRQREIEAESVQVAQQVLELTLARQQAGAGGEEDVNLARSEVQDAELALRAAELADFEARSGLGRLMSLAVSPDTLELVDDVPEPMGWGLSDESLLELAAANRLDIRAGQQAVDAALAKLQQAQLLVFPALELGVGFERDERRTPEGRNVLMDSARASVSEGAPLVAIGEREKAATDTTLGPSLSMELPIFNQNQGGIARARLEYQQSCRLLDDLLVQVHHEVWLAVRRAQTAWADAAFYRDEVLPLRERSLELSRAAYVAGRTSILNVLEAERALLSARSGYAQAQRASATAVVELERVTGQPLSRLKEAVGRDQGNGRGGEREGSDR